jgi:hypothetical protein
MVATLASDELQAPPDGASDNVVVLPTQTVAVPDIAEGRALTVNTAVFRQPPAMVYVILAVPAATPITMPVVGFIVPMLVLPLLHVPPAVASVNVVVRPTQTDIGPVIAGTVWVTVTTDVEIQPEPRL